MLGVAAGDPQSRVLPESLGVLDLVSGKQDDVQLCPELLVFIVGIEEELGDANCELHIVLRSLSLLNDESATMVRGGRGGEQRTLFAIDAGPSLVYVCQLKQN